MKQSEQTNKKKQKLGSLSCRDIHTNKPHKNRKLEIIIYYGKTSKI